MGLSEFIKPSSILFFDSKKRDEVLESLAEIVVKTKPFLSKYKLLDAVIQRERIVSTGLGGAVALPHAKIDQLQEFVIALAICKGSGVEWNALDGEPVKFIFMILGPTAEQKAYLKLLSDLTVLIRQERFLKSIAVASDAEMVCKIIHQYDRASL